MLTNPSSLGDSPSDRDLFVGRGSFGIVKYQQFRGIKVAVKEFLPHTVAADVQKEGQILSKLCHPYLPLFFGIAIDKYPYIIVMQYHGVDSKCVTLQKELSSHSTTITPDSSSHSMTIIPDSQSWLILCCQMSEALRYLHDDVNVIHNDLKSDNILLTPYMPFTAGYKCKHTATSMQISNSSDRFW